MYHLTLANATKHRSLQLRCNIGSNRRNGERTGNKDTTGAMWSRLRTAPVTALRVQS